MATEFSTSGLSDALVILGAAGIVIPAFARFRISPVIGFILIGMLVGPSGLGALVGRRALAQLRHHHQRRTRSSRSPSSASSCCSSRSGSSCRFRRLWGMRRLVFGVGAAELLVSALLIGARPSISAAMAGPPRSALGLALALSSTAVVLPLVGTTSPVGRSAFAMLLFEDLALVPIIFALGALAPARAGAGVGALLNTLGLGALVIVAMLVLGRFVLPRLFAQAARTKSPELFLVGQPARRHRRQPRHHRRRPVADRRRADRRHPDRRDRISWRGRGDDRAVPRASALGIFLITVGMSSTSRFIVGQLAAAAARAGRRDAGQDGGHRRCCCGSAGARHGGGGRDRACSWPRRPKPR